MKISYEYLSEYVKRAQAGDSDAFAQCYGFTYERVYNYTRHYLRDDYLAQDAVQEVYISALKNIHKLSDPTLFVAWLNQIAFRVCYDMSKSKKTGYGDITTELLDDLFDLKSEDATGEEIAVEKDERERLKNAIDNLKPASEKEIVVLRFYNDMKIEDIAEATGLSRSTVKRQLKNAMEHLKEALSDKGNAGPDMGSSKKGGMRR